MWSHRSSKITDTYVNGRLGYVYLIHDLDKNVFKIGVTRGDVNERLKKLQTGNSSELYLRDYFLSKDAFFLETMLHNKYASLLIMNEWYELDLLLSLHFKETCQKYEKIIESLSDNYYIASRNKHKGAFFGFDG